MKFKKIFALGFAASALVFASCSNDELEGGDLNPTESGKGYLTVAFATNTNSSRAVVDDNTGDGDGSSEDSNHHLVGTEAENKVNSVLIIGIAENPANSFTQYYNSLDATPSTGEFDKTGDLYSTKAIEVAQDKYTVNVIVNPSSEILNMSVQEINHKTFTAETLDAALTKVIGKAEAPSFMMSGRESRTITVDANTTEENPATSTEPVEVERVVAKISFRPTTIEEGGQPNVYPVKFTMKTTDQKTGVTTVEEKIWYVQLQKYALVNLSKELYAIRHITKNSFSAIIAGGTLLPSYYLVDPKSVAKNSEDLTPIEVNGKVQIWNNGSTYFWQTLAEVTEESAKDVPAAYFKDIPDGNGNQPGTPIIHDGEMYKTVGTPLSYCFENSVIYNKQVLGLSTGIAFMAKIYENKECTKDLTTELYKYAGNIYTSLTDLENAYSADPAFKNLASKTDAELEELGIAHYKGGKCYYYTSQIKHYDDGDNTTRGVMEFAIMRNNIYSLAVESIDNIGDATLKPFTPDIPDEEPKSYLKVQAKILPWIVRFNNIKF